MTHHYSREIRSFGHRLNGNKLLLHFYFRASLNNFQLGSPSVENQQFFIDNNPLICAEIIKILQPEINASDCYIELDKMQDVLITLSTITLTLTNEETMLIKLKGDDYIHALHNKLCRDFPTQAIIRADDND